MAPSTITPTFTVDGKTFTSKASAEIYLERVEHGLALYAALKKIADLPKPAIVGLADPGGSSGGVVHISRALSSSEMEICLRELANRLEDALRKGHPTAQALTEYLSAGVAQNNRRAA